MDAFGSATKNQRKNLLFWTPEKFTVNKYKLFLCREVLTFGGFHTTHGLETSYRVSNKNVYQNSDGNINFSKSKINFAKSKISFA